MHWSQLGLVLAVTLGLIGWQAPARAAAPAASYAISAIDPPPGLSQFWPTAINNAGQVVGTASEPSADIEHAALWRQGAAFDLGTLGGLRSRAADVNDSGLVVGESWTGDNNGDEVHAFVWDGDLMRDLGLPGRDSGATAINASGLIVGYERDRLGTPHALVWDRGEGHRLDRFQSGFSRATGVDDVGRVVLTSYATGAGGNPESYIWQDGPLTSLGPFEATRINVWGQVAVYTTSPGDDALGLIWQAGSTRELGQGVPYAINDAGQVVGSAWRTSSSERAFAWQAGTMRDLNETIPSDSGWELWRATAINNAGQIVGYGLLDGAWRGFLLTPTD